MIPVEKIKQIVKTYETLEKELASPNLEKKDFVKKSKEYSILGEVIKEAKSYINFEKEKEELEKITEDKKSDKEIIQLAKNELNQLSNKTEEYEKILKVFLLPKDEADVKNAILEIRAGTGGLEATLFVADLYKMYEKVCLKKKWSFEIINISKSDAGGFKEVILLIKGNNIYSFLKYESGVHRVAVLPEAEDVDVKINEKDLRIDVFRSSGPGGQSVNTTDSAVRITHIPSGTVVSQQDEKSQHKNRAKAMKILRSRVYEAERKKKDQERSKDRKSQIGTGDRSERIRTYNFPQGRVTDHRINLTLHKLEEFLSGDAFEEIAQNLKIQDQEIKLSNLKQ